MAIADFPFDVEPVCTVREVLFCRGALEAGAHRVTVVFDHEDHRDVPKRDQVECFHEGALVDRTIAKEGECAALEALVLECECEASAEWRLSGDDSVSAPIVFVWCEKVHRATFAFGAPGVFAIHFRHTFIHRHTDGQCVAVVAIRGDDVVVLFHQRDDA